MKVLLDENLGPRLRHELFGHEAVTVVFAGWGSLKNGELLKAAEQAGYEVLLTADQGISYQQNLERRRIAIVVLTAHDWTVIRDHLAAIRAAVDAAQPGSFQLVQCGQFRRS